VKKNFPGYYRPSNQEFHKLWTDCFFVPDANILLHLFRYGEKTRAQVIETLAALKPRIWIPYRVGLEFQRSWRDVDQNNRDAYEKLSKEIENQGRKLAALFDEYTRHQMIDVKAEQKGIDEFIRKLCKRLADSKAKHPSRGFAEKIFLQISDLIGDDVGSRPTAEATAEQSREAQKRYDALIPPGYRDAGKGVPDKYGDYFIWKELLDKSKETGKPVILITDDVKDDWWLEFRGEKISPRPELVEEMFSLTGQGFYLYTLSQFLDYAGGFLESDVDKAALEEIKSDEVQRRELARREHVIPFHLKQRFLTALNRRQRELRQARRDIDAQISAIGDSPTPEEITRIRDLLEGRAQLSRHISQHSTRIRNYRTGVPGLPTIAQRENQQFMDTVRRAIAELRLAASDEGPLEEQEGASSQEHPDETSDDE